MRDRRRIYAGIALATALLVVVALRLQGEGQSPADLQRHGRDATSQHLRESPPFRGASGDSSRSSDPADRHSEGNPDDLGSDGEAGFGTGTRSEPRPLDRPNGEATIAEKVAAIRVNRLRASSQAPTIAITGRDPLAPRELLAWRIKGDRFAIVARGSSDADGGLQFPDIVEPGDGLEVVVTAADSIPGLPGASDPRRMAPRDPRAPQATVLSTGAREVRLRVFPTEAHGEVLLADSYGVVFASYPVPSSPVGSVRIFDIALSVTGAGTHILLRHAFGDGRTSDWFVLELPSPPEKIEAPQGSSRSVDR